MIGRITRLALADFRERTRRFSFIITLAFALYSAYLFTPPNDSSYVTLQLEGFRGIYNSAWIGALVAIMSNLFLSLAGFYLTKNSISRDYQTRVGQILAASPMKTIHYVLSKGCSNMLVLGAMTLVLMAGAAAMQIVRGEDYHLRWALCTPFLLIVLPTMTLVAASAVLFESLPPLRRTLGNFVFFFVWIFANSTEALHVSTILGVDPVIRNMTSAVRKISPGDSSKGEMSLGFNIKESGEKWHLKTFAWNGMDVDFGLILGRCGCIAAAGCLLLFAALCFDRFDSARVTPSAKRKRSAGGRINLHLISPLLPLIPRSRFVRILDAEFTLMTRDAGLWWTVVASGFVMAGLFVPLDIARGYILPLAWIWPIALWSSLGSRESLHGTDQILFSTPHPLRRLLPAAWAAGVLLALISGSFLGIRLLLAGDFQGVIAWAAGAAFIPTLALGLGVWTGNGKMFEVLYLILWYAGPMNKVAPIDFMGSSAETPVATTVSVALLTILILSASFQGRRRRLLIS